MICESLMSQKVARQEAATERSRRGSRRGKRVSKHMEVSLEVAMPASGGRQLCAEAGRPRSRGGSKGREYPGHGGGRWRQTGRRKDGGREWESSAVAAVACADGGGLPLRGEQAQVTTWAGRSERMAR